MPANDTDTNNEQPEATPSNEAVDRRNQLLEQQQDYQNAKGRAGVIENRGNKELTPLSRLVTYLDDEITEIEDDAFLTGEDEAEALRSPPDLKLLADVDERLNLSEYAIHTLADFREALEQLFPGLDFAGSPSSTLPQLHEVLEDQLASRKKFWQDRAQSAAQEAQELKQEIESERRKLRKFCRRHDLPEDQVMPEEGATLDKAEQVKESA
jgi:hypothetical protein